MGRIDKLELSYNIQGLGEQQWMCALNVHNTPHAIANGGRAARRPRRALSKCTCILCSNRSDTKRTCIKVHKLWPRQGSQMQMRLRHVSAATVFAAALIFKGRVTIYIIHTYSVQLVLVARSIVHY